MFVYILLDPSRHLGFSNISDVVNGRVYFLVFQTRFVFGFIAIVYRYVSYMSVHANVILMRQFLFRIGLSQLEMLRTDIINLIKYNDMSKVIYVTILFTVFLY